MGKRGDQSSYEVWVFRDDGRWIQVVDGGNEGIFESEKRALAVAGAKSSQTGVVEVIVIERNVIASFNGEAISLKGQLMSGNGSKPKKEKTDGSSTAVHGGRASKDVVATSDSGQQGEGDRPA